MALKTVMPMHEFEPTTKARIQNATTTGPNACRDLDLILDLHKAKSTVGFAPEYDKTIL
jgi:hypothetical protein